MRQKNDKYYLAMSERLNNMTHFIQQEINSVEPHTVAWYRLYELHTQLEEAKGSLKLIHSEVLGNTNAYKYEKEIDMRERISNE